MAALVNTIYATGGGAYKFEEDFIKVGADLISSCCK